MTELVRVVAAAIVRDGRVLAARRQHPAPLAGGWEFPGGKIEADESDGSALRRECAEELGVEVEVGSRLGAASDQPIELVLYAAQLASGAPVAGADHDELRWLAETELDDVAWLPIDRTLLPAVRAALTAG